MEPIGSNKVIIDSIEEHHQQERPGCIDIDIDKNGSRQAVLLFYRYFVWSKPLKRREDEKDMAIMNEEETKSSKKDNTQESSTSSSSICHDIWWNDPNRSVEVLSEFQQKICSELQLKGRILIAEEGINGTVSGNYPNVVSYMARMKGFDLVQTLLHDDYRVNRTTTTDSPNDDPSPCKVFDDVDWKISTFYKKNTININTATANREDSKVELLFDEEPFPDLKISRVKEIVSTGGIINVMDLPSEKGKHLTPEEFHEIISAAQNEHQNYVEESCEGQRIVEENDEQSNSDDNDGTDRRQKISSPPTTDDDRRRPIALIDVRNTFEHNIGHFVHPGTGEKAMDPQMVTFSSFDKFCEEHAEELKYHKVLMYCTGKKESGAVADHMDPCRRKRCSGVLND
jgi:predicted sulfurtransferase